MRKEPLLSFVIPVYQKPPEVFDRCLRSLFDQSLRDFEVIAVFDGPNPGLEAVCRRFPRVKTLHSEHRGGPKARNTGLDTAKGRYVVFWDADCIIKPNAAQRWLDEFKAVPDADFVYTGYELGEGLGTFDSEPFDRYSLECGNFISTMSPIKREKALRWDETLEAAQDWDYWLRAAKAGLKGVWIEGSAFVAETCLSGISQDKWSAANRDETIYEVREKNGIPRRSVGVYSMHYRERAIKLAQILGADVIKPTGPTPSVYKTILNVGYSTMSRFEGIAEDVTKIQYWLPAEIEGLKEAKYASVMETIRIAKGVVNLCNTSYEQNQLSEFGITSQVAPLPLAHEDIAKVATDLPKEFSILVATDVAYAKLLNELPVDLPHIQFHYNAAKVQDFSCFLSFYRFAALDNALLIAHANGRNVISNVQAPFCGFIDPDQNWENFKFDLYQKIREVRHKPFNKEARDYYLEWANPEKFKETIASLQKPALEVLAV